MPAIVHAAAVPVPAATLRPARQAGSGYGYGYGTSSRYGDSHSDITAPVPSRFRIA